VLAALAAGNAVILKPAPETVWSAWHLANQLWAAGVPPTVLQFVPCPDNEVGRRLVSHPDVNAVVLTGSIHTAVQFYQWRPELYLMAETSGKNAIVVTASADIDASVRDLVTSAFGHAGQKCSAASLAIVEASVYDHPKFRRQLADAVRSLRVGPAWDPSTDVGPLIAPPGDALRRALTDLEPGEHWLVEPEARDDHGHLWSPGVRLGVQPGSFLHTTECFGPVLGVMRAPDLDTAIAWQNATPFGLTGGIQSLDETELDQWIARVEVGNAYINRTITGAVVGRQPFGGRKASAVGPAIKAGGPHYVSALARAHDPPGIDRLAQAESSYAHAATTLLTAQELAALRAEHNLVRHEPLASLAVWVAGDDAAALEDLALIDRGARQLGVALQVYSPHTLDLHFAARYCAPEGLASVIDTERPDRVRAIGAVPADAYRAAHRHNIWIDTDRPVADGAIELRHYVREQSVSVTNHRFGNIDAAPLPQLITETRPQPV
jgi:RHH-type proline utilization regulon transcriptional repressor/proline dehydrogenase/delta 1-pyrroline-5-carboxylate dehydrogenase